MPRTIIAISNHKGGTAKTTTCASIAAAIGELGQGPVLVVDCDPTGALTTSFKVHPKPGEKTVYHALLERGTSLRSTIRKVNDRLHLVPAERDLAAAEILLIQQPGGEFALQKALREVEAEYPYVLLDCPPNLGKLTVNALAAADGVLIPLTPAYLSLNPMAHLMETIETVRERLNPSLRLLGLLLTQFNRRMLHAVEVEERLRSTYPGLVFEQVIAPSVRFQEAPAGGVTILEYEPNHPGAAAYRAVAKELIHRAQATNHPSEGRGSADPATAANAPTGS